MTQNNNSIAMLKNIYIFLSRIFSTELRIFWVIFFSFLIVRILFVLISGDDGFSLQSDSLRYNKLSNQILNKNFNLLTSFNAPFPFINSPIIPYLQALYKLSFGTYWVLALQFTQIILSSLSGIYLYKITKIIWNKKHIALVASGIYCIYPFTFWFTPALSQDMLFQCFLIFTVYFLLKFIYEGLPGTIIISAVLFSITFLIKSHVLLFSPFILIVIFLSKKINVKEKLKYSITFTIICLAFTLPYGLYNLKENGIYVFSSSGLKGFFLLGHNDDIYKIIVTPPEKGTGEYKRLYTLQLEVFTSLKSQTKRLSHAELENVYFNKGLEWCRENPEKFLMLKLYNFFYFLLPSVNPNWYSFKTWLGSLAISLPIYLFAYIGMFLSIKRDFKKHFWILGLFLTMIIFSVGFYVQNRFRTITIEPFYIIYAAFSIMSFINYLLGTKLLDTIRISK